MDPLQQEWMTSSFSSTSILHTTGSQLHEYSCILQPFRPEDVSSTGKQTDVTLLDEDRDVRGTSTLRSPWKMAVREL
jgi:hypothetical protein